MGPPSAPVFGRGPRAGAAIVIAGLSLGALVAVACEDSDSSVGKSSAPGDNVTNDTRDAEPRAPANPDPRPSELGALSAGPTAALYNDEGLTRPTTLRPRHATPA